MDSKVLVIYEYKILFEILNEIKENLNFKIVESSKKNYEKLEIEPKTNLLILSSKNQKNIDNCLVIENLPLKLEKLLELININFLKKKFSNQSHFKIGEYNLDLNSRKISTKNKSLNLTERETKLIIFINEKKNVTIKDLQKHVWDYSSGAETHPVETHISRLRKKMKENFGDDNFILNNKNGYSIDK